MSTLECVAVESRLGDHCRSALAYPSAWFASCIDDRPPDYEPGAVIRISIDESASDMGVLLRMMHVGSAHITTMRVTLPQVLHAIPRLMHRFGADRTLWRLLPSYLIQNPWKWYGLDRVGSEYTLRENVWAVLRLAHNARDAKVWANTVGLIPGTRPPDAEWQFLWDPFGVPRSEITPEREILYKIILAATRMRARVGFVEFEYTDKQMILYCKKVPGFKIYFALEDDEQEIYVV